MKFNFEFILNDLAVKSVLITTWLWLLARSKLVPAHNFQRNMNVGVKTQTWIASRKMSWLHLVAPQVCCGDKRGEQCFNNKKSYSFEFNREHRVLTKFTLLSHLWIINDLRVQLCKRTETFRFIMIALIARN